MACTAMTSFRMNKENKERVKYISKMTKRSSSFIINYLLDEYLDDLEDIFIGEQRLENLRSGHSSLTSQDDVKKEFNI